MLRPGAATLAFGSFFFFACACNGQFDFDTHTPRIDDAGVVSDAAEPRVETGPPPPAIACGSSTCPSPGCCKTTASSFCSQESESGTCPGLLIECDDAHDCPQGQVCCAEGSNDRLMRVHCETQAHCLSSNNFFILCDPNAPGTCAQCVASSFASLPPGYHQCVRPP